MYKLHIVTVLLLQVSAVSAIVNQGTPLKAYVFRNYNLMPGVRSHYLGGCQHQLWQALRASSAAPGYFQEFALGPDLHQVMLPRVSYTHGLDVQWN
jgi:predicted acylesterase/phospholipase RssA